MVYIRLLHAHLAQRKQLGGKRSQRLIKDNGEALFYSYKLFFSLVIETTLTRQELRMSLDIKHSHEEKHRSTCPGLTQKEVKGLHQTHQGKLPLEFKLLSLELCGKNPKLLCFPWGSSDLEMLMTNKSSILKFLDP